MCCFYPRGLCPRGRLTSYCWKPSKKKANPNHVTLSNPHEKQSIISTALSGTVPLCSVFYEIPGREPIHTYLSSSEMILDTEFKETVSLKLQRHLSYTQNFSFFPPCRFRLRFSLLVIFLSVSFLNFFLGVP